ncbi:AMP-binding protein [Pseudomonas aeruginosa]|nr:AMP-binding protein [Pseudomonas aeruginosa]
MQALRASPRPPRRAAYSTICSRPRRGAHRSASPCAADRSLSYAELERESAALAVRLRAAGVAPEQRVGVCLRRDRRPAGRPAGVLRAGGCYVPLDPAYPEERVELHARRRRLPAGAGRREHPRAGRRAGPAMPDAGGGAATRRTTWRCPRARSAPTTSPTSSIPPDPPDAPRASPSSTAAPMPSCAGPASTMPPKNGAGYWRRPRCASTCRSTSCSAPWPKAARCTWWKTCSACRTTRAATRSACSIPCPRCVPRCSPSATCRVGCAR